MDAECFPQSPWHQVHADGLSRPAGHMAIPACHRFVLDCTVSKHTSLAWLYLHDFSATCWTNYQLLCLNAGLVADRQADALPYSALLLLLHKQPVPPACLSFSVLSAPNVSLPLKTWWMRHYQLLQQPHHLLQLPKPGVRQPQQKLVQAAVPCRRLMARQQVVVPGMHFRTEQPQCLPLLQE